MRKLVAGLLVLSATASVGCNRNAIDAVNLANEGDKAKATSPDEAISKYEQAANLDQDNHRIQWRLMQMYKKKEQWDKVITAAAKAEKKAPTFANYFYMHGFALARQAEKNQASWSDARGPLEAAIQKDANLADAYYELAEVMLHLDDENAALKNYTKAIETKPDDTQYYGPLADMYVRLGMINEAEQITKEGLSFAKEGDKHISTLHSLAGDIKERKGDIPGAISSYEAAKKACGQCNEPGQAIVYFNLGHAYARATRKSEAIQQLSSFQKMICRGAGAARYADQCATAQADATALGGALQ
ncbi:MAG: hypothetical protein U0174_28130 [Polyangiaceae bacterium]